MSAIPIAAYQKDPSATLDYTVDWGKWLGADTISAVTWPGFPAGLTQVAAVNTSTQATTWISGGLDGTRYEVTCRVQTVAGRIDERTFVLNVTQR